MSALAVGNEDPPLTETQILEPEPEHLAAPQTAQQHRLGHGPVPLGAQRRHERLDLVEIQDPRQSPHTTHKGAPRSPRCRLRRVGRPRGTGLVTTPASPRMTR